MSEPCRAILAGSLPDPGERPVMSAPKTRARPGVADVVRQVVAIANRGDKASYAALCLDVKRHFEALADD